ncbi:MAG: ABC transporter permease [Pseudomonadota bacterium]
MSLQTTILWHSIRRLARSPAYGTGLIATLALGIAVCIVAFSVLYGILFRTLPYPEQQQVVRIESSNPAQGVGQSVLTPAEAESFLESNSSFSELGYFMWGGITLIDNDRPQEITVNRVSAGYFPALGVIPRFCRFIDANDIETNAAVAVISSETWRRLGSSTDIVGQRLETSNGAVEVIGVMPAGFEFPNERVGVWQPLPPSSVQRDNPNYWNARYVEAVGRLKPGVDLSTGQAELNTLAIEVRDRFGVQDLGWTIQLRSVLDDLVGGVRWILWSVFAVSLLVLLVACANVAALVGGRLIERRRQLTISMAVGATHARLRAELAIELAIATLIAAVIGTLIALVAVDLVRAMAPDQLPRIDEIVVDWPIVVFTISVAMGIPFIVLALGATVGMPSPSAISESGRGTVGAGGRRTWLPSLGLALSTTALIGASALALSLVQLIQVEPGYRTDNTRALQLFRGGDADEWRRFASLARDQLLALPGVTEVAVTTSTPGALIGSFDADLQVPGRELTESMQATLRRVDDGYLPLLSIPLEAGRAFSESDHANAPGVAIINRTLANRVFGDIDPIGRELSLPMGNGPRETVRIIGITSDIRNNGLRSAPEPEVLVPFDQFPWVGMTFIAHAPDTLTGLPEQMREVIWNIDPTEGFTREFALSDDVDVQTRTLEFFTSSVSFFAASCLLLGALGVYSVLAFVQRRRIPELGMRLALGASPLRLFGAVLADAGRIVGFGLLGGLIGSMILLKLMSAQLYGLGALPWLAITIGAATMAATALVASLIPAWKAATVSPIEALRYE